MLQRKAQDLYTLNKTSVVKYSLKHDPGVGILFNEIVISEIKLISLFSEISLIS